MVEESIIKGWWSCYITFVYEVLNIYDEKSPSFREWMNYHLYYFFLKKTNTFRKKVVFF